MNSSAEDIATILETSSAGTGLTVGTDLFVSREPDTPDAVVSVFDTGGGEPSSGIERYDFPTVQVRVRGDKMDYENAYVTMESIKTALHKYANQTVNGTKYIAIWASSDIFSLGYDENDRPLLTLNFRIHRTA